MGKVAESIAVGLIGAGFLHVFYSAIRNQWPESYVAMSDAVANFVSTSLARYLAFRLVPIYVAVAFATVVSERIGAFPTLVAATLVGAHLFFTNVRALRVLLARREHSSDWVNLVVFNIVTAALLIATTAFAVSTRWVWRDLIPRTDDVVLAFWTALLAAVLAAFLRNIVVTDRSEDEIYRRARRDLGEDLWLYAGEQSARTSCDVAIVRSILLAEVLQRPAWTRQLERWKGELLPHGTYGVAQMGSRGPIDDRTSIDLLCQRFSGYRPPKHSEFDDVHTERFKARIEQHNSSALFVENVVSFYDRLVGQYGQGTDAIAVDGRPVIEVAYPRRRGQRWEVMGSAVVFEGNIVYSARAGGREISRGSVQADFGAPRRGDWIASFPLVVETVKFSDEPMSEDVWFERGPRSICVDME